MLGAAAMHGCLRRLAGALGCAALGLAACGGTAQAGALAVSPTRIELSSRSPVATLDVRNDGDEQVTLQVERVAWTQPDGSDQYVPSSAFIATPTVFDLAPHSGQLLRIALRDKGASAEQAYRVYVSEVRPASSAMGTGLNMALRIGIPIFVEPTEGTAQLAGDIHGTAGAVVLRLRNDGARFTRALGIEMRNEAGTVLWQTRNPGYLLAGGQHDWPLDALASPAGARVKLAVTTEHGVEHVDMRLPP